MNPLKPPAWHLPTLLSQLRDQLLQDVSPHQMYKHAHHPLVLSDCVEKHINVCFHLCNFHKIPSILLSQFVLLLLASESPSAVSSNPTQLAPRGECSMYYYMYCTVYTTQDMMSGYNAAMMLSALVTQQKVQQSP